MNVNYNDHHQQNTTCTVIYIYKAIKLRNVYLYINQTLCKNQDNSQYVFVYENTDTLRYAIFHEILEIGIYIQKPWHFALHDFFKYKNRDSSQESRHAIFHGVLEIGRGGGGVICKNNALCITFLYAKRMHFLFLFVYKKPYTLCYICICKTKCTFCYVIYI